MILSVINVLALTYVGRTYQLGKQRQSGMWFLENKKTNFTLYVCDPEQGSIRRTDSHTGMLIPTANSLSGAEDKKRG